MPILLDRSAACDAIDHDILSDRLDYFSGFKGKALSCLRFYLSNKYQCVNVNSDFSIHTKVQLFITLVYAFSAMLMTHSYAYVSAKPDIRHQLN